MNEQDVMGVSGWPSRPVIWGRDLGKSLSGQTALENFFIRVYPGQIMTLLGTNGAGKTTALRILATIFAPDSGELKIFDTPHHLVSELRPLIGYLPDIIGGFDELTISEYLRFCAQAYGLPRRRRMEAGTQILNQIPLDSSSNERLGQLTSEQRLLVGLAGALVHDPPILLLDEPLAGLSQKKKLDLNQFLLSLREQGKTVVLTSDFLDDVASVSDRVTLLDRGRVLFVGPVSELRETWRELSSDQPVEADLS